MRGGNGAMRKDELFLPQIGSRHLIAPISDEKTVRFHERGTACTF